MDDKRFSYFSERKYMKDKSIMIDKKVMSYWERVLGLEVIKNIQNTYNISLETVLGNAEYNFNISPDCLSIKELFQNNAAKDINYTLKTNKNEALVFDRFFIPFVKLGIYILKSHVPFVEDCIIECFSDNLISQISKISLGTLMFEMYLCKEQNQLIGKNSKEEYAHYNQHYLGDKQYIEELFKIYPCLERMIWESILYLTRNYESIVERLNKDHNLIVQEICSGTQFTNILKMQSNISDSHKKGKTVAVITLDNGMKVVYKPRSLAAEKSYQRFLNYISVGCHLKSFFFKIVDCGNYGWEAYVKGESCSNMIQLQNYYYRFGILILINYILNANDLHEENLIAAGEYPVVIDAETILDNHKMLDNKTSRSIINERIRDSVLFSGLLPHYRFSEKGKGIDMSAIKGIEGEEYPILIPRMTAIGTSNMHYEYVHPIKTANNNLATLNGEFISPSKFIEIIDKGFRDAYSFILKNKDKTLDFVNMFNNTEVRHLIQDTQRYSMILHTSYHPDFLQDSAYRQLALCTVIQHIDDMEKSTDVAKLEIEDMIHMDVPYFLINTCKTSLFGSNGEEVKNYFEDTSMQHLKAKIQSMSCDRLEEQSRFLKIILTDLNDYKVEKKQDAFAKHYLDTTIVDSDTKQLAIERIADIIMKDAVWSSDKKDVNWIGVTSVGGEGSSSWQIQPLGNYLYEGLAGLAIFFNTLAVKEKTGIYTNICQALQNNLFSYTEEMEKNIHGIENESSGVFCGESALVYTYEVLYKITNNHRYLQYAERHEKILQKCISEDKYYDIVYGNAGAIITLINLFILTKKEKYITTAIKAGEILVNAQHKDGILVGGWSGAGSKYPLAGFSHGASGIAYALTLLWHYTQKKEFLESAIAGIRFEDTLYSDKYMNWRDEREYNGEKNSDQGMFMTAWCHGAAGILLSRCKILELVPEKEKSVITVDIKKALTAILQYGFGNNDCLCHGNLGNTEIINEYCKVIEDKAVSELNQSIRSRVSKNIMENDYDCGRSYLYGYNIPGFMTGYSGIGYSLLRDIYDDLPCILSLEI